MILRVTSIVFVALAMSNCPAYAGMPDCFAKICIGDIITEPELIERGYERTVREECPELNYFGRSLVLNGDKKSRYSVFTYGPNSLGIPENRVYLLKHTQEFGDRDNVVEDIISMVVEDYGTPLKRTDYSEFIELKYAKEPILKVAAVRNEWGVATLFEEITDLENIDYRADLSPNRCPF